VAAGQRQSFLGENSEVSAVRGIAEINRRQMTRITTIKGIER
jgi:hypothetical protein